MKRYITIILAALALAVSCTRFDDSAIWEELLNHKERIEKLEAECNRLNSNISALQVVLEAIQSKDYVTDIVKVVEDGVEIGYSLTFAKGGTVTIYHGTAGENGSTPKIGIQKASDGQYYWTSDGEWLTDEEGEKIPASYGDGGDGKYITPLFRVAEGVWHISYDNGNSWQQIDSIQGGSESLFSNVTYDEDYVYLTLADGTSLAIARSDVYIAYEGEDLTHLFDFDAYPAEAYSVGNHKYTSSIVFDSAMADLSEYAGRTIEITIPQYSNINGKEVGYATIMVDAEKNYIRSLKKWEVYTAGAKNGVLKVYKITLPKDMKYIYTSTYMLDNESYLGENDGRTDFSCKVLPSMSEADVLYNEEEICDYYAIGSDGKPHLAEGYGCSSFIDCKDALKLNISMIQHTEELDYCLCFYDSYKNLISSVPSLHGAEVCSVMCEYDVPEGASYFKASYFDYNNAKKYGQFSCVVSYPNSSYIQKYRPYQDGIIYYSPKVNVAVNKYWEMTGSVQYEQNMQATTGALLLPSDYDPDGQPVPVIMYCHGASHGIWYDNWGATDNFRKQKQHWADMGFAVFDCTGAENNNRKTPYTSAGSPQFVQAYRQCYEYLRKHYNISDDIYVCGVSAGGPVGLNYTFTYNNVRALVLLSTWVDISPGSGHEWDLGYRASHVKYLGFNSTSVYEYDKAKGTNPADHIVTIDGTDYLMGLNVPLRAMIGASETAFPDLYRFVDAARNSGNNASIRVFPASYTHTQICSGADIVVDTEVGNWFLSN